MAFLTMRSFRQLVATHGNGLACVRGFCAHLEERKRQSEWLVEHLALD